MSGYGLTIPIWFAAIYVSLMIINIHNTDTINFLFQESLQTFDSPKQTNLFFSCYQEKTLLTSSVQENSLDFIEEESKHEGDLSRGHVGE